MDSSKEHITNPGVVASVSDVFGGRHAVPSIVTAPEIPALRFIGGFRKVSSVEVISKTTNASAVSATSKTHSDTRIPGRLFSSGSSVAGCCSALVIDRCWGGIHYYGIVSVD